MELNDYLALSYPRVLTRDEDGQHIATIPDLPGCTADGATEAEALENLKEVQAMWLEAALSANRTPPLPKAADDLPSGKWVQRVPRTLHARLVAAAKEEQTSLNQLVISLLSEGLTLRTAWKGPAVKMAKANLMHAWGRHECDHIGRYKWDIPNAQTEDTAAAAESLRRSDKTRPISIEQYCTVGHR